MLGPSKGGPRPLSAANNDQEGIHVKSRDATFPTSLRHPPRMARRARPVARACDLVSAPLHPGRRPARLRLGLMGAITRCGWGGRLHGFTHFPGSGPASSKTRGPLDHIAARPKG